MTKKIAKNSLCILLAVMFVFASMRYTPIKTSDVGINAQAATASELRKKQSELKDKQAEIKSKLSELKNEKSKAQEYLNEVNALIAIVKEEIENINGQIEEMDANIADLEAQISEKEVEISESYEKFKQRLRAIYISGDITGGLEMILCADSFEEMLSNSQYVESMAKYDQDIIDSLKSAKEGYLNDKQKIEGMKEEVNSKKKELSDKKAENDALAKEAKEKIAEIEAAQKSAEAEQKKIDAEMDDAKKELDALAKKASSSSTIKKYAGGTFAWPTPGYYRITSPYGPRWGKLHKGIDIGAPTGVTIVAANSGVVTTASWQGSYGNCIMIDHGGGYLTVYAHMSSMSVSSGQSVSRGQKIGAVGSTGRSTGPHLHFEVRVNGTAQNPQNFSYS